jgi:hypothetical protein
VVFFDRWDTCLLISGPYVTYISENVKNGLRDHVGKAVQILASEVKQRMNPGDALIRNYELIGPAPEAKTDLVELDGISLRVEHWFRAEGKPIFVIHVVNASRRDVDVRTDQIGINVLGTHKSAESPSDGLSEATITRAPLWGPFGSSTSSTWLYNGEYLHAAAKIHGAVPARFRLKTGDTRDFRVKFDISGGEYQFVVGYGGGVHEGRSLISNAVSFNVDGSGYINLLN